MWEKPVILVVDNEPLNVELLQAILPSKDYDVVTAEDGDEALKLLARQKVDLVLLDVMMPNLNGFEVTRLIRADPKIKGMPVILITALGETADRIMGIEAGCDEFVTKPFDKQEVLARIRTLLKLNYYRSQIDEKDKFEHIVNRMNDGLIICDAALNIVKTNQKGRELLGSEDLSPGWVGRLGHTFKKGYRGDLEHDLALYDLDFDLERPGTSAQGLLIVSFSTSVIKDTEGKTVSVVISLHDVTEQRKNSFQRENFLSVMSSKLRSPLAASLGHLEVLRKSSLPAADEDCGKSVDLAIGQVSEFLNMTEKIFDFLEANASARFEESTDEKDMVTMEGIEAMVRAAAETYGERKVECAFDLPAGLAIPIREDLFKVLVKNLVENAVKFNAQAPVKIEVSARQEGQKVKFCFSDNGPGIPIGERRSVFENFQQAGGPKKSRTAPGLGLGLPTVKTIVEGCLGDICVDAKSGAGACISFTLPIPMAAATVA
jgi:CheY-like chemotaxis protein/signal transduction histidine kinase